MIQGCDRDNLLIVIDFKTAPSFAESPKIGGFERVLVRGREMAERGEEGVAR